MVRIIDNPRQLILEAAEKILFTMGYSSLNMRNVAKECGIALGTIYNYFPTKQELIIDMMTGYWHKNIIRLESLVKSDTAFYDKLRSICEELQVFINTFKVVWLKPELYDTPDYVESGLKKQDIYMEKLIKVLEELLTAEAEKHGSEIRLSLGAYETAKFIVLNFITITQMSAFSYDSFEKFLKKLL